MFQRLDDAADLYRDHLGVDLPTLVGPDAWKHLTRVAAIRHVLVHNAGIVDSKFLNRLPTGRSESARRSTSANTTHAASWKSLETWQQPYNPPNAFSRD